MGTRSLAKLPYEPLTMGGYRVVRIRSDTRCKCCHGGARDTVERWFLMRKLSMEDKVSGKRVTMDYMIREAETRFGFPISANSYRSHMRNHMDILRDETAVNIHLTEADRVRKAVPELEEIDSLRKAAEGGYEPGGHQRFLEEVVQMGRARIRANPAAVTVDHALAAAKELSRLKQDENRAELIRALASAGAVRIGRPEVQRVLEAEVSELAEA